MRWTLAVVLLALGCGTDPEPWEGDWFADGGECGVGLSLKPSAYTVSIVCGSGTAVGLQIEAGTLQASGNVLTFTPKRGTCPGPAGPYTGTWARNGRGLGVTVETNLVLFQPLDAPGTSTGTATLGCYADDGTFTPHALADL